MSSATTRERDLEPIRCLLYTQDEMAESCRVSARTLRAWVDQGCPEIRIGGRKLYNPASVVAWVENRSGNPVPGRQGLGDPVAHGRAEGETDHSPAEDAA